ncbi:hypothetical protein D3C75_834180 [compost metagenome]
MFSGPMPRRSICRLLPRAPLALLPVRLTPGSRRMMSDRSLAGGWRLMSSAVMIDVPRAWRASRSAVTRVSWITSALSATGISSTSPVRCSSAWATVATMAGDASATNARARLLGEVLHCMGTSPAIHERKGTSLSETGSPRPPAPHSVWRPTGVVNIESRKCE